MTVGSTPEKIGRISGSRSRSDFSCQSKKSSHLSIWGQGDMRHLSSCLFLRWCASLVNVTNSDINHCQFHLISCLMTNGPRKLWRRPPVFTLPTLSCLAFYMTIGLQTLWGGAGTTRPFAFLVLAAISPQHLSFFHPPVPLSLFPPLLPVLKLLLPNWLSVITV